ILKRPPLTAASFRGKTSRNPSEKGAYMTDADFCALFDKLPLPADFRLKKKPFGKIRVHRHAWERFIKRFPCELERFSAICGDNHAEMRASFMRWLRESFDRAQPVTLNPKDALIRLLHNGCKERHYYLDHITGLYFSIDPSAEDGGGPIVVTVV